LFNDQQLIILYGLQHLRRFLVYCYRIFCLFFGLPYQSWPLAFLLFRFASVPINQQSQPRFLCLWRRYIKLHLPRGSILTINAGHIVLPTTSTGLMLHHSNTIYHSLKTFKQTWQMFSESVIWYNMCLMHTEVHNNIFLSCQLFIGHSANKVKFTALFWYYFVIMGYVEEGEEMRQHNYSKKECWYFCLNSLS
jgi:hypothetical protein